MDKRVVKSLTTANVNPEEICGLNESLFESAANASKYANIIGPVVISHRNLQFVLTAVLSGV